MWKRPIVLLCSVVVLFSMVVGPAFGGIVPPEDNGQILKNVVTNGTIGIGPTDQADSAIGAAANSNPATFIPGVGGSNYVFQFDLDDVVADAGDVNLIDKVFLEFVLEGNDDPELEYGYGIGVANSAIVSGDFMSPGPLVTATTPSLDFAVSLNVTTAVTDAINNGDQYLRVALTADPTAGIDQQPFVSASFFGPELNVEIVPEPSTFALFGLGFLLYGVRRYRRRK